MEGLVNAYVNPNSYPTIYQISKKIIRLGPMKLTNLMKKM